MKRGKDSDLDELIEEITTDAFNDEEQFSAFHTAFEDQVDLPAAAMILGQTVSVIACETGQHELPRCRVRTRCNFSEKSATTLRDWCTDRRSIYQAEFRRNTVLGNDLKPPLSSLSVRLWPLPVEAGEI